MVLKFSTSSPVNSLPVYGTILRAIFSTRKNRLLICFKIYLLSKLVFKYDKLNNYAKKNRFKGTLSIHAVWDKSPPLIIFQGLQIALALRDCAIWLPFLKICSS